MARTADVVVIGGGIIGCAVAYYLAREKVGVTLLEKEAVGLVGATYASAGMLEPLSRSVSKQPLQELALQSFRLWPQLLGELSDDSGFQVDYVPRGRLLIANTEEEAEERRSRMAQQAKLGLKIEWLSSEEVRKLESLVSPEVAGAVLSDEEHQLNSARVTEALKRAALRRGATFREHTRVIGIKRDGSRVTGVETLDGVISASQVVVAAGSWTCLLGDSLGIKLPVYPVRGQVLYLHGLPAPVRYSLDGPDGYAVPKGEFVLVGTTVEHVGFDERVTAGGALSILQAVQRFLPSVANTSIHHTRAGLRPRAPDDLPILGPVPGVDGLLMASGHYRSGILLAPITGRLIADAALGRPDRKTLQPYRIDRFKEATT